MDGLVVPITVPLQSNDRIDEPALAAHIDLLQSEGVRRLLVNGTTGEFFSLTEAETEQVFSCTRRVFEGELIANVGRCGLAATCEAVHRMEDAGADGIMVMPPFYLAHVSAAGLIAYMQQVAKATENPLWLYNFTRHTQNALTPEVLQAVPHAALKDSDADFELINSTPAYFIGGDKHILKAYDRGACGFVSAAANSKPAPFVELARLLKAGDRPAAAALHQELLPFSSGFSGIHQIALIKKSIAESIPEYPVYVRPPLVMV